MQQTALQRLENSQMLSSGQSLKTRLANLEVKWKRLQKLLSSISKNTDVYRKELSNLKQAKQSFEGVFDAKNNDIKKTLSAEIDRISEELKRYLNHQKGQNSRIQMQLGILKQEKQDYQNKLKIIRDRLEHIEREVGDG